MSAINDAMENRLKVLKEKTTDKLEQCPNCKNISLKNGKCINEGCGAIVTTCQVKGHENLQLDSNGECPSCKNVEPEPLCIIHNITFNEKGICPECEETIPLVEDEIDEFSDAIVNGHDIESGTVNDAIETMRLVFSIYYADESWREKYDIRIV